MLSVLITTQNNNKQRGKEKLLEGIDTFMTQIMVMVSWVYAYLQTHQIVSIKHVQLFVCQ